MKFTKQELKEWRIGKRFYDEIDVNIDGCDNYWCSHIYYDEKGDLFRLSMLNGHPCADTEGIYTVTPVKERCYINIESNYVDDETKNEDDMEYIDEELDKFSQSYYDLENGDGAWDKLSIIERRKLISDKYCKMFRWFAKKLIKNCRENA